MKKAFLIMAAIALIALLVTSIAPNVSAHPGGTDGNGGHRNRSTGEYHYHHGYPEHDHYDMDGDGKADCPYDFDDQTDRNNGVASEIAETIKTDTQKSNYNSKKLSLSDIFLKIFDILWGAIIIWLFCSYFLSYICFALFGEERGCTVSIILGAVISLAASIWLFR